MSTAIALSVKSVYNLLYLYADLLYVLLFPQFLSVIHFDPNTYGSIAGYVIGLAVRLVGGEVLLDWKPLFPFPGGEMFPNKTLAMLMSLLTMNSVSYLARYLFEKRILDEKYDILKCNLAHGGRAIDLKEEPETEEDKGNELEQQMPLKENDTKDQVINTNQQL